MTRLWKVTFALSLLILCAPGAIYAGLQQGEGKGTKCMREFRGVKLGLKTDEVRAALGKPETSADSRDEYKLGGDDLMTVYYEGGLVKAIQLYFANSKNVPAWAEVVGNTEIKQNDNGSKHARLVVGEENFWVAMFQNKGATITTITISR
jgi:hypothetical protein